MRRNNRLRLGAAALAVLSALTLSACASASGGVSAGTATGKPIVIGLPESDKGNGFNQHHYGDALSAWASDLNAAGGIGGRPIELVRCNDEGTADGATKCMRGQVQNPDIVLGTGFSPYSSAITGPGFLAAGIPWLAAAGNSAADLNGAGSTRCVVPTAIATYQALPTYAINDLKLKKVAALRLDVPQLALLEKEVLTSTAAAGGEVVLNSAIPLSAADFSPQVQQAIDAKADLIVIATSIPSAQKIIQTAGSLGYKGVIGLSGGYYDTTTQDIITKLDGSGITFISDAAFPDYRDTSPDVTAYRESLTKHGFQDNLGNDQGAGGWASGQYLQKVLESIGPDKISRETVTQALKTQTFPSVPMFDGPVGAANATTAFPALGYIRTHIVDIDKNGQHWHKDTIDLADLTANLS